MTIDPLHLLYACVFLSVLLLVEGLYLLVADRMRSRAVNRRQRLLDAGAARQDALATLLRRRSGGDAGWLARLAPLARLDRMAAQAGVRMATPRLLALAGLWTVAAGALALRLDGVPPAAALALGLAAGAGTPLALLAIARRRRLARFGRQLPDALDVVVRSLRAGHPVSVAVRMVGEQMADPIGSEFGVVVDEMTYGLELREALERLCQRVGHPELGLMVVAIKVQHQSGGNLAEVLSGLARVLRAREAMRRKVRSLSAEGRLSAWILTVMPFLVAGGVSLLSPGYFRDVQSDPLFAAALGAAGTGLAMGVFFVWRIVNVRI
ncbi:type II secretion system F family protein [Azospirillum sp. ST 5-10]|uniref:type II secretion system F family protein n=1 Tax=unclassified Azospirillum TaxID=2630922 RepID=UPI003F4A7881